MNYVEVSLLIIASSFIITFLFVPFIIKKAKKQGIVGKDVNKTGKEEIPEMGGVAIISGLILSLLLLVGYRKILGEFDETSILSAVSVVLIASIIGLFDDFAFLSRKSKAIMVTVSAIPLLLSHPGTAEITLPFNNYIDFTDIPLFYWIFIVPLGITGASNAVNMCAGYNGLECGQTAIISFFLLLIMIVNDIHNPSVLIFSAILGSSLAFFYYNSYPARIFIGDVGTLPLGAAIAVGTIIGNIEFYGFIIFLPAFYELFATVYFGYYKRIERRDACMNPVITGESLSPPKGAERYTLAYFILSQKSMSEGKLVNTMLFLFAIMGLFSFSLAIL